MKRYILIFLIFLSIPLYSQNFRLNVEGALSRFENINDRQVSFYGLGLDYSYYFLKKAGLFITFDHYFPTEYYGVAMLQYPVYITGGANSFDFGLRYKVIDPDSKRIEVNGSVAISSFIHKGSYYIEDVSYDEIYNKVKSVCLRGELILKKLPVPLAVSAGYNYVFNQNGTSYYQDLFSVPFSSYYTVKFAFSLPVMKGPAPDRIKKIDF